MTRFADSFFRDRRRSSRYLSSVFAFDRARAFALSVAFGLAAFCCGSEAFSQSFGTPFGGTNRAASSKSQFFANQRAANQQQARQQYQAQLATRQQAQFAAQQQAQFAAQQQAQFAAQQQAQANQGRAQASTTQRRNQSSPRLLSGLFGGSDAATRQTTQQAQSVPQQSFATNREAFSEPPRNNILGMQPIFQRSSQQRSTSRLMDQFQPDARPQRATADVQTVGSSTPIEFDPQRASSGAIPSAEALARASTDRNEANDLLARIPWENLSPKAKEKIRQLTSTAIYRRLPMAGGRCNPELFDFFLSHPNAVVELWRAGGYEEISMVDEGYGIYSMSERSGSKGKLQILYQDSELTLAYSSGSYRGAGLGRPVNGEMFLALQTRYTEDANRTPFVVCRIDAFVDIKNPGADLLARAFSSALGKIADSNFEQTLAFIDSVSQTIEENPAAFAATAMSLQGLSPDARRVLATKAERVGAQAEARRRGQIVEYQLLPKMNLPTTTYARILSRGADSFGAGASVAVGQSIPDAAGVVDQPISGVRKPNYETPESFAKSALGRNSSLGRSVAFNRSEKSSEFDFSLADDDDFESSIDWDDEESESSFAYSSKGEPIGAGSSLAKIGAKPSTRANAMSLLDKQENRVAPGYSRAFSSSLSTDDEDDDSLDLSWDEDDDSSDSDEIALDDLDVGEEETGSLVALPFANNKSSALKRGSVAAAPLSLTEADEEASDDSDSIILVFPDDANDDALDSQASGEEPDDAKENEDVDAPLLVFTGEEGEESEPENSKHASVAAPIVRALEDAEESASNDPNASEVDDEIVAIALDDDSETAKEDAKDDAKDDAKEETIAVDKPKTVVKPRAIVKKPARKKTEESAETKNQNYGWTSGNLDANVRRVASNVESSVPTRTRAGADSWSGASVESSREPEPSKLVTRRYARADDSARTNSKAKTLATFSSKWQEPDEGRSDVPVDVPTFKRPE